MKGHLDLTNRSALEYNQQMSLLMKEICSPLHIYGIKYFTYSRTFKDGKKLYICSNHEWVKLYIKNSFQDEFDHLEHYIPPSDIKHALWIGFKQDKVFDAAYNCGWWNGFSIYEHYNDYVDLFDFFADKEDTNTINFYINNIVFLNSFISDFKKKISKVIDWEDQSKFMVAKNYPYNYLPQTQAFIEEEQVKNFIRQINLSLT